MRQSGVIAAAALYSLDKVAPRLHEDHTRAKYIAQGMVNVLKFLNTSFLFFKGMQWISGRVLDWRQRGHGFEPHRLHCIVSLSKTY